MSMRGVATHPTVGQRYLDLVEKNALNRDPEQEMVAAALDHLLEQVRGRRLARKSSALGWLFARNRRNAPLKGLYIHGDVGRGKTMLMDLFYELVPARGKRRAHFHDFMADVHDRIARHREALKNGETTQQDPIPPVAEALASEAWILCFDEFSVTDIADAMILSRLFSALFAQGVVLVATSNVAPRELYRDGLNRGLFEPFIDLLTQHVTTLSLNGNVDYRLEKIVRFPVYVSPLGEEADRKMDEAWKAICGAEDEHSEQLKLKGRAIAIPRAAGGAARFGFADLCEKPLGARDYLAIAKRFHTILIDHVPVMDSSRRNEAKRFILLIDTLYDQRRRLFLSAEAPAENLYCETSGTEAFEFQRTVSRLFEMQSHEFVQSATGNSST